MILQNHEKFFITEFHKQLCPPKKCAQYLEKLREYFILVGEEYDKLQNKDTESKSNDS